MPWNMPEQHPLAGGSRRADFSEPEAGLAPSPGAPGAPSLSSPSPRPLVSHSSDHHPCSSGRVLSGKGGVTKRCTAGAGARAVRCGAGGAARHI